MELGKINSVVLKGDRELHALCAGKNDTNLINVITTEVYYLLEEICKAGKITFHCFTSEGFDQLAVKLLLGLKQKYQQIEITAYLSIEHMSEDYIEKDDSAVRELLITANKIEFVEDDTFDTVTDAIINNVSKVIVYSGREDTEVMRLVKKAKERGVDVENIFDNLNDYFSTEHPAKLLMQAHPDATGFRYSKSGIVFAYEGVRPLSINFAQIKNVTCKNDNFTLTLANDLVIEASVYSEEKVYVRMERIPAYITEDYLRQQGIDPKGFVYDIQNNQMPTDLYTSTPPTEKEE